jgi:hypothetical protein
MADTAFSITDFDMNMVNEGIQPTSDSDEDTEDSLTLFCKNPSLEQKTDDDSSNNNNTLMIIIKDKQGADGSNLQTAEKTLPDGLVIKPSGVSSSLRGIYTTHLLMPEVIYGPYVHDVVSKDEGKSSFR